MTSIYMFVLLFVFVTLLAIAWAFSPKVWWHYYFTKPKTLRFSVCLAWALLGTFLFHNVW